MIKTRDDLKFYLLCDEIARWGRRATLWEKLRSNKKWRFNVLLRKMEFNHNCRHGLAKKVMALLLQIKMTHLSEGTGWEIPINTFGPGLCIVHKGPVIVNAQARFGANCRFHAMVNIGAGAGKQGAPKGGNRIYFGPGAKIFGDIEVGSNIAIGANAVVNKSFLESNVTIAGIPAGIVSNRGCDGYVIDAVAIAYNLDSKSKL